MATALRGLKGAGVDLTAIVSMADDGGSSGILRARLGIPPVGDLRNCLIALADAESTAAALLQHRLPAERGATRRPGQNRQGRGTSMNIVVMAILVGSVTCHSLVKRK